MTDMTGRKRGLSKTGIPYATHAWNFVVGCTHSGSPGCDSCWARELHDRRFKAWGDGWLTAPVQYQRPFWDIQIFEDRLCPSFPREPSVIFVLPQSDIFHEALHWGYRTIVNQEALEHSDHIFLLLTKRPQNIPKITGRTGDDFSVVHNLWLGVTVCNQEEADTKIPQLIERWPGPKWLSIEPMLGRIDLLDSWMDQIGWVIVGGESGKGARSIHSLWPFLVEESCFSAHVPYFFKQWSSNKNSEIICGAREFQARRRQFPAAFPAAAVERLGGVRV